MSPLPLLLVTSLWTASQTAPLPPASPQISIPIDKVANALATDLALIGLGTGLDLISTDWATHHGCVEGNPLIPRVEGRVGLKIGAGALQGSLAYWLRRKGKRKVANVLRWARFGTDVGITTNNVVCGLKERK